MDGFVKVVWYNYFLDSLGYVGYLKNYVIF